MSATVNSNRTNSPFLAFALVLTFGIFALPMMFVTFAAAVELLNAGENVLIETWPGLIAILAIASYGAHTTYTEYRNSKSHPIVRERILVIGACILLIIALLAMTSTIMFRLTHGG